MEDAQDGPRHTEELWAENCQLREHADVTATTFRLIETNC